MNKNGIDFLHYMEWMDTIRRGTILPIASETRMFNSWQHTTYHIQQEIDEATMHACMLQYQELQCIIRTSKDRSRVLDIDLNG